MCYYKSMENVDSNTVKVGSHQIAIEVLPVSNKRDQAVRGISAQAQPLPLSEWPMTPAEIETAAGEKLISSEARPERRDDCEWAVKNIDLGNDYFIRPATTTKQRSAEQARARRDFLRGDLS